MTRRELAIHPLAQDEILGAARWYAERSKTAAEGFGAEIEKRLSLIAERPEAWQSSHADTRRIVLDRFPFSLVYRVNDDHIQIVALVHHRRRPGYWIARLTQL